MSDEVWRSHPLMRDEAVKRWMRARTLRATYRLGCLQSLQRYCDYRQMTPNQLITESISSRGELDPEARLKPKDMLNKWKESIIGPFGATNAVRRVLPFFEENGATIEMRLQNPETPARENRTRATQALTKRFLEASPNPAYKWGIICMAESGMRPNSVVNLELQHVLPSLEEDETPLRLVVPGRITKTGQPYSAFVLDDAKEVLRDWLKLRRPDTPHNLILPYSAQALEHYVDNTAHKLGINPASGLRPFTCGNWRKHVQNSLESYDIARNRISLLMGRRPTGADAHYTSPPPEVLATEYLKAANQLRIL